ncbi:MAG TPA: hypothetical protein VGP72_25825 [Planctomycetota bacterium]|jgi:hypothetical protein
MYSPGIAWLVVILSLGIYYFTIVRKRKGVFDRPFKKAMDEARREQQKRD